MADEAGGPGWYTCVVNRAGPAEDGTIFIMLTHQHGNRVFANQWFSASPAVKREMLATALTALTTGWTVTVNLSDSTAYSVCNRLYVVHP
jgi:hypothetical protein